MFYACFYNFFFFILRPGLIWAEREDTWRCPAGGWWRPHWRYNWSPGQPTSAPARSPWTRRILSLQSGPDWPTVGGGGGGGEPSCGLARLSLLQWDEKYSQVVMILVEVMWVRRLQTTTVLQVERQEGRGLGLPEPAVTTCHHKLNAWLIRQVKKNHRK